MGRFGVKIFHLPPHHFLDQSSLHYFANLIAGDRVSVSQDQYPIAQFIDLLQLMADINAADAGTF